MTTVKLNGVVYPIRFSAKALREFGKLTGKIRYADLMNIGSDMTLDDMVAFIYCGVKSGAEKANMELALTLDDFWNALDDDITMIGSAFAAYAEDQPPLDNSEEKKTEIQDVR